MPAVKGMLDAIRQNWKDEDPAHAGYLGAKLWSKASSAVWFPNRERLADLVATRSGRRGECAGGRDLPGEDGAGGGGGAAGGDGYGCCKWSAGATMCGRRPDHEWIRAEKTKPYGLGRAGETKGSGWGGPTMNGAGRKDRILRAREEGPAVPYPFDWTPKWFSRYIARLSDRS